MKTTCFRLCLLFILCKFKVHATDFSFYLECPPNVTINCTDDVSHLDKYGQAYVWLNYKKNPLSPKTTIYNTNACGIGTITRTWEAEDPYWKIHTCSQTITVTGSALFTSADIKWPRDTVLEGCNPNPDPKNLPYLYAYPQFNRLKCSQPMYSYKDTKFTVSAGCMKIIREWKVIDWCQYVPNKYPAVGQWSYFQIIKLVASDTGAALICPRDTTVESKLDCKGAFVRLDSARAFSKCGYPLSIRNTSPYAKSKGPDASGDYPLGSTEFYYIAEYGCGKEIKCKVRVKVTNKIGPVPYCLNGLIVALMPVDTNKDGTPDDGMVQIWAKDFNVGSYHPCGYKQLKFSFSPDTSHMSQVYTCADLGKNEVRMYVTDSLGNQSFCKTYVEIQNNNARIPDCKRKDSLHQTMVSLSGLVLNPQGEACSDFELTLTGDQKTIINRMIDTVILTRYDTVVGKSGTVFFIKHLDTSYQFREDTTYQQWKTNAKTNQNGLFEFKDITQKNNYQLAIQRREQELRGININDAIVLLKHLSGTERITDPYKLLAADINGDLLITQSDFDLLYQIITGSASYDKMPIHWRFIRKPFLFADPLNPFTSKLESWFDFKNLQQTYSQLNFTAIRIGELDGFSGLQQLEDRNQWVIEEDLDWKLNVYPNPITHDQVLFTFQLMEAKNMKLEFWNSQMQLIKFASRSFDKGIQRWGIDLSDCNSTGFILYSLSDGEHTKYGKLMYSK